MNTEKPLLPLFRATPYELLEHPPLASSLQSFETCLFLIAMGRLSHAVVICATAWESAIKAKTKPEGRPSLRLLVENVMKEYPILKCYASSAKDFREFRNGVTHFGYSPKDDEKSAQFLLETGIPFLMLLYSNLFDFYLDWHDIREGITDFHSLPSEDMGKVGLIPDIAEFLHISLKTHQRARNLPRFESRHYFQPLGRYLLWCFQEKSKVSAFGLNGVGMLEERETLAKTDIKTHLPHLFLIIFSDLFLQLFSFSS